MRFPAINVAALLTRARRPPSDAKNSKRHTPNQATATGAQFASVTRSVMPTTKPAASLFERPAAGSRKIAVTRRKSATSRKKSGKKYQSHNIQEEKKNSLTTNTARPASIANANLHANSPL